jgi:hypothetical protein
MIKYSASNIRPSFNYNTESHNQVQQLILYRSAVLKCSAAALPSFYYINNRNSYIYLEINIIWPWMAWVVLSKKKTLSEIVIYCRKIPVTNWMNLTTAMCILTAWNNTAFLASYYLLLIVAVYIWIRIKGLNLLH